MADGKTQKKRPVAKPGKPLASIDAGKAMPLTARKAEPPVIKATLKIRAAVITCEGSADDIQRGLEGARGILAIILGGSAK